MDGKSKAQEVKVQQLKTELDSTQLDLANAVILIQEKDAELARITKVVSTKKTSKPISYAITAEDADNAPTISAQSQAGFGTRFPADPRKGDMFLRVDMLPNKLYKWNGQKWIEVAKSTTDRYAYEEEYIKYITGKIITGEYDMDDLSKPEQEEVLKRLSYDQKGRL